MSTKYRNTLTFKLKTKIRNRNLPNQGLFFLLGGHIFEPYTQNAMTTKPLKNYCRPLPPQFK